MFMAKEDMTQEDIDQYLEGLLSTPQQVFSTIGVYNSGNRQYNGVRPEHLKYHVEYNLTYRGGRALFVEGKCVHSGYLDSERISNLEKELAEHPHVPTKASKKYY